ncbi:MAG: TIGR01548 family HAD-type hydrolase [Deltaproteobacteria bacterium]|nr:TIGR01548 family HAD-type hydrolase [Deltaproteobacteria bacterium]
MSMDPEALLFDMDGVLADVSRSYRQAVQATAKSYGVTVDGAMVDMAKRAGNANDDWQLTQRLIAEHGGLQHPLDEVTARFEALYQGSGDQPGLRQEETLIPSRSLLSELAARLPLAIVTGRPRADAERFLEEQQLQETFRVVICREDGPLKPDPTVVRLACEKLGVSQAWMIGDTPDDVRAAREADVVPMGILAPGDTSADALWAAGASRVLTNLDELKELLP